MLGLLPVSLAFLRAVYPAAADTFGFTIMQDVEGVAVEDGDDGAGVCHCLLSVCIVWHSLHWHSLRPRHFC